MTIDNDSCVLPQSRTDRGIKEDRISHLLSRLDNYKKVTGGLGVLVDGEPCFCIQGVMVQEYEQATGEKLSDWSSNAWMKMLDNSKGHVNPYLFNRVWRHFFGDRPQQEIDLIHHYLWQVNDSKLVDGWELVTIFLERLLEDRVELKMLSLKHWKEYVDGLYMEHNVRKTNE